MEELSESELEQNKPVLLLPITAVEIFPDPFTDKFRFDVTSTENRWLTVIAWDSNEQILQMFHWYIKIGTNRQSLILTGIHPPGLYRLELRDNTGKTISTSFFTKVDSKPPEATI